MKKLFQISMMSCIAILVIISIISLPHSAYACSCMVPKSPKETLAQSKAVFLGKVLDMSKPDPNGSSAQPIFVKFAVNSTWKGPIQKAITVSTAASSVSCGYEFELDNTYLVYAYGQDDSLQAGLCSRTKLFSHSYEDLRELGDGAIPEDELEKVCLGGNKCPEQQLIDREDKDLQNLILVSAIGLPSFGVLIGFVAWRKRK